MRKITVMHGEVSKQFAKPIWIGPPALDGYLIEGILCDDLFIFILSYVLNQNSTSHKPILKILHAKKLCRTWVKSAINFSK